MLVEGVTDALDHQDEIMDIVGHSIKKAAKKLHRLELMMHNEPSEDAELRDKLIWNEKMNKLLKYDVAKRLPTLREIQIAQYKKQKTINKKTGHKPTLIEELKRPDSRQHLHGKSLEKFRDSKKLKEPGPQFYLGSKPEGESIRIIKNYRGINSSFGSDRTLVVKEGRCGKFESPTSSLPEWFHPGYYENADHTYLKLKRPPSASSQIPFKSTGRYPSEDDDMDKTRKRIVNIRNHLLQSASLAGSNAPDDFNLSLSDIQDQQLHQNSINSSSSPMYHYYSMYSTHSNSSPRYASPQSCHRSHSHSYSNSDSDLQDHQQHQHHNHNHNDLINPWTSQSSSSTINKPVYHNHQQSPRNITLSSQIPRFNSSLSSSSLNSFTIHEGYISTDDLSSEYFDQQSLSHRSQIHSQSHSQLSTARSTSKSTARSNQLSNSLSSIYSNTNTNTNTNDTHSNQLTDRVSITSVDTLLVKAANRQKNKYKINDYTLGALDQQVSCKLVIPDVTLADVNYDSIPLPLSTTTHLSPITHSNSNINNSSKNNTLTNNNNNIGNSGNNNNNNGSNNKNNPNSNLTPQQIKEKEKEKEKESILQSLYHVTTSNPSDDLNSNSINSSHNKSKNRSTIVLDSIQENLQNNSNKATNIFNESILLNESITSHINRWTKERNYVEVDLMRPRKAIWNKFNFHTNKQSENIKNYKLVHSHNLLEKQLNKDDQIYLKGNKYNEQETNSIITEYSDEYMRQYNEKDDESENSNSNKISSRNRSKSSDDNYNYIENNVDYDGNDQFVDESYDSIEYNDE